MRFGCAIAPLAARVTFALTCLLACSESEPEEGRYQLRELRHTPVPYVDTLGCCTYTGGYLRLSQAEYDIRIYFHNRQSLVSDTAFETGSYYVRGDSLVFRPAQGNQPFALFHGTRSADTITVLLGGDGPGAQDQWPSRWVR
jgi:hypothetical protein